jgi:hypothetical protein
MKHILPIITALLFNFVYAVGQQLAPITKTVGKLSITVDPRMELLSAVQVISDYPTINRKAPYSTDLMQFFGRYNAHEASQLTSRLATDYDFASDAPADFILRLSQVPELKIVHPFLGPIRTFLGSRKIAVIYPTDDSDTTALQLHLKKTSCNMAHLKRAKLGVFNT